MGSLCCSRLNCLLGHLCPTSVSSGIPAAPPPIQLPGSSMAQVFGGLHTNGRLRGSCKLMDLACSVPRCDRHLRRELAEKFLFLVIIYLFIASNEDGFIYISDTVK